jgi:hypothetical protein
MSLDPFLIVQMFSELVSVKDEHDTSETHVLKSFSTRSTMQNIYVHWKIH